MKRLGCDFFARSKLLAAIALALLTTACTASNDGPRASAEPVRIDLADRLPFADVARGAAGRNLCGPHEDARLTSGWIAPGPSGDEAGLRWTRAGKVLVEVPIVEPSDAALWIDLARLPARPAADGSGISGSSTEGLLLLWNGEELTRRRELDGPFEVGLPASRQRVGPNRLELRSIHPVELPRQPVSGPESGVGMACRRIELRDGPSLPSAEGVPPVFLRDGTIVQRPGSVVSFGLKVPSAGRLLAEAHPAASDGAALGGTATVSLLERGGRERVLAQATAGSWSESALRVDADVADLAGQHVLLSLAFSGAAASNLVWRNLQLRGERGVIVTKSDGLPRRHYNVLVVLLDSLRADDVLSDAVDTPTLDRLAADGVRLNGARSNASWTRTAVVSMLSSLAPPTHGVEAIEHRVPHDVPLLPRMLRARGYRTLGVSANAIVSKSFGFDRAFEKFHLLYLPPGKGWGPRFQTPEARARVTWRKFFQPMLAQRGESPFFAYLHEMDPHSPFTPPPPYDTIDEFGYEGDITFDIETIRAIRRDPSFADEDAFRHLRGQYRGEIAFMDRYLGWLLDRFDEHGLRESTLVVVLSDHGEEFFDHRSAGHGHTLYEELLRIPWVMRLPGVLPAGVDLTVGAELIDLAPTILDLLGEEIPDGMEGRSLLPALRVASLAAPEISERPSYASSVGAAHSSVKVGRWKLIRTHASDGAPDQYVLYDLVSDPREAVDVFSEELVIGGALRQQLAAKRAQLRADDRKPNDLVKPSVLSSDEIENLRALGYVE